MVVFDAYGTLWNIQGIEEAVAAVLGRTRSASVLELWRKKQLEYAWLRTLMDRYEPFREVTRDALSYTLKVSGLQVTEEEQTHLLDAWNHPAPFPDASWLLPRLSSQQRIILSNGDAAMLEAGLRHSGLQNQLDGILSVDLAGRYKPHPAAYRLVLEQLGAAREDVVFVSSNGWDIAGASHFGFRTIWVNRGRGPIEELSVKPWKTVSSLSDIASIGEM